MKKDASCCINAPDKSGDRTLQFIMIGIVSKAIGWGVGVIV